MTRPLDGQQAAIVAPFALDMLDDAFEVDAFETPAPATRRRMRRLCAASLVAAIALFAASPLVTLWQVGMALERKDLQTVEASLDWRSVRDGLKGDVALLLNASAQQDDDLPGFGESFASTVAVRAVDDAVTPARLQQLLAQMQTAGGHGSSAAAPGLWGLLHAGFTGLNGFQISYQASADAPVVLVAMRVEKWRWKIVRIDLPDAVSKAHSVAAAHA